MNIMFITSANYSWGNLELNDRQLTVKLREVNDEVVRQIVKIEKELEELEKWIETSESFIKKFLGEK